MKAARGEPGSAVVLLEKAREGFSELGARWEAARTALSLADALLRRGRSEEAVAHLEVCIPVLEELRSLKEVAKGRELLLLAGN
jgi:hypothetical protein